MMEEIQKIPTLYMLIGLPGSGKSTIAKEQKYEIKGEVFSSNELRKELFGTLDPRPKDNGKLFDTMHSRIKECLLSGKDAIYDATNIKKRRRIAFLEKLKKVPCKKVCVVLVVPYEKCLEQNAKRAEQSLAEVPAEAIRNMYLEWEPPHKSEGWDEIRFLYQKGSMAGKDFERDMRTLWLPYDQGNSHHFSTLGEHMLCTEQYLEERTDDRLLKLAASLHDIGKPFVRTQKDKRGNDSEDAHYYSHQNVGAYEVMFYKESLKLSTEQMLDICNLVFYHMHPYLGWKESARAKEQDRRVLGEEMFNRIMLLHEADVEAH